MSTLPPSRPARPHAVPDTEAPFIPAPDAGPRADIPRPPGGLPGAPPGGLTLTVPGRPAPPRHLADLDPAQLRESVVALGERPFRARQLSVHYFSHHVDAVTEARTRMTDLPAATRDRLVADLLPPLLTPAHRLRCDGGTTVKTAWRLFDGAVVESVLMRYPDRVTVCVSSQAGCGMSCPFCATGQAGLIRNLSTAEIVDQVVAASRAVARGEVPGGRPGAADRVGNVVLMGMGEPLANYPAVVAAVHRLVEAPPDGPGISARGITLSTVGLVPAVDRLAAEGLPVTLAVSLHAPDDGLRDELVPVNTRWPVAEVLDAARRYFDATGRRVSIEYALIREVNDQARRADELAQLLNARGRGWVHVNLIPLNPTPGSAWTASGPRAETAFLDRLRLAGVPATIRDTRGREIDGACGQLAATT